jgi:hypothetical protein
MVRHQGSTRRPLVCPTIGSHSSSAQPREGNCWCEVSSLLQEYGEDMTMADSDELTGHLLRMAQERRLLRFCAENGIDHNSPDIDNPDLNLLGPILDSDGAIVPEPEDIQAVKQA